MCILHCIINTYEMQVQNVVTFTHGNTLAYKKKLYARICVCMWVDIHICTYICIYICPYLYIHAYIWIYMFESMHSYMYICTFSYMCMCTYENMCKCTFVHICTFNQEHVNIHKRAFIFMHLCAHVHTYIHSCKNQMWHIHIWKPNDSILKDVVWYIPTRIHAHKIFTHYTQNLFSCLQHVCVCVFVIVFVSVRVCGHFFVCGFVCVCVRAWTEPVPMPPVDVRAAAFA